MLSVDELRQIFPDCEGRSDEEILRAYHAKFYGKTDFDRFLKQYAASIRARGGKTAARSGASREKSQRGQDQLARMAELSGYGMTKAGNFYPFLKDKEGRLELDEKGEPILDRNGKPADDEKIQEWRLKANGQGLQPPQAGPAPSPAPPDPELKQAVAEAENYEGEYLNDAIMRGLPGAQNDKLAALRASMNREIGERLISEDPLALAYQSEIEDVENHGYRLRKGYQGAALNALWGQASPEDRDFAEYRRDLPYERATARQAELEARMRDVPPEDMRKDHTWDGLRAIARDPVVEGLQKQVVEPAARILEPAARGVNWLYQKMKWW